MSVAQADKTVRTSFSEFLSPTEELLEEARRGRMFILVDDEDRETRATSSSPRNSPPRTRDKLHGPPRARADLPRHDDAPGEQLGLPLMRSHGTRHQTAFSVSIVARDGVTTGISAADRARTVRSPSTPISGASTSSPPVLSSRCGAGGRHAGPRRPYRGGGRFRPPRRLNPAGVICEIMNDDGTMAA